MPITETEKEDVLMSVAIEMEGMFHALSNHYSRPEFEDQFIFLAEIEARIKQLLLMNNVWAPADLV